MDEKRNLPTEDECWASFWDVIGPALVDAYRDGRITEWPDSLPAAA